MYYLSNSSEQGKNNKPKSITPRAGRSFKMAQYSLKWSNQPQNHLNEKCSQCWKSNWEAWGVIDLILFFIFTCIFFFFCYELDTCLVLITFSCLTSSSQGRGKDWKQKSLVLCRDIPCVLACHRASLSWTHPKGVACNGRAGTGVGEKAKHIHTAGPPRDSGANMNPERTDTRNPKSSSHRY